MSSKFVAFLLFITSILIKGQSMFEVQKLPKNWSEKLAVYWYFYKARFNKTYSCREEPRKRLAWELNVLTIYEHNLMAAAGNWNYTLGDNPMADLCLKSYQRNMIKLLPSRKRQIHGGNLVGDIHHDPGSIPISLDWRQLGFETAPINQRSCGSCYAYSITGSIEGQIFKKTGLTIPLSAQQIVDCSTITGNLGCTGGSLRNTMRYLEKAQGLMTDINYPYKAKEDQCRFQDVLSVINITSWAILPARNERALEVAVATIGPIATSINASPKTFQLYHTGIYDDPLCSSDHVNHAMLIVGYSPDYWILKNWWGHHWGEDGYMRIRRNANRCGIANYAAYARI